MQIRISDVTYDSSISDEGRTSFQNDLSLAIGILESTFTADVKVSLVLGYGVDARNGSTLADQNRSGAIPSDNYPLNEVTLTYPALRQKLLAAVPGFFNDTSLPNAANADGLVNFNIAPAQARVFGLLPAYAGVNDIDGYVNIGTGFTAGTDRIDALLHEITHALGREPRDEIEIPFLPFHSSFDLFRFYSDGGGRDFDGTIDPSHSGPVAPAYFSLNGGETVLADYGIASDPSDFLNSDVVNDPFDEFVGGRRQAYVPRQTTNGGARVQHDARDCCEEPQHRSRRSRFSEQHLFHQRRRYHPVQTVVQLGGRRCAGARHTDEQRHRRPPESAGDVHRLVCARLHRPRHSRHGQNLASSLQRQLEQ
jgi:hypothetical protein